MIVVLWVIVVLSQTALPAPQKGSEKSRSCVTRILFLGNSYTYFNNLPALVSPERRGVLLPWPNAYSRNQRTRTSELRLLLPVDSVRS
jgi:hypothetical protein